MMDIHDSASVRNLERIQETHPGDGGGSGKSGRGATFALVVLSGACIVFAALAFGARRSGTGTPQKKADPLADLTAKQATAPTILPGEVTFPGILSDRPNPATALAAAQVGNSSAQPANAPNGMNVMAPPPATDKLLVVPLPAKHTVNGVATQVSKTPDKLSALADGALDPVNSPGNKGKMAVAGSEGGWQLQVSSFRTEAEADAFMQQLRARGHKAHVQRAEIPSRGTWYRVKIGPFATMNEATKYRSTFEAKEKMPGFVVKSGVDPH
jgi:cell division septation protein DedD